MKAKKYSAKAIHKIEQYRYELGVQDGRKLQKLEQQKDAELQYQKSNRNRIEIINKLLSTAAQYQETITILVQAAEKQL